MKSFIRGFSGVGCFLGVVLFGAITSACLSSEESAPEPTEPTDQTIEIPQELTLPRPHPNKCGCHTDFDCDILCGVNLMCLPAPGGGDGTCVTRQAFDGSQVR